ncbi:MAG: response regulator [Fidelibacterota bacterium]|nr:MAG: response regulator [Candidatus Neomarinimicrobiota bacterium]
MDRIKRILVIDPDDHTVEELTSLLSRPGVEVERCLSIPNAVAKMQHIQYDCIIVDMDLKDVKGYDAVPILKTVDPSVNVIVTSRINTKDLETRVRAQDIFYYFIKSFNMEELKMAVNNAINHGNSKDQGRAQNGSVKVLVIDDDQAFLDAMQTILESASYQFVSALDPKTGLEKVKSEKPDIILLDIMMDTLFDGFSLCHTLKGDKEYRAFHKTPIIFVSAVKEIAGSRFAFDTSAYGQKGPDDYLDKPIEPQTLLGRIERLLKR